jgi:hypothetical protein
MMLMSINLRPVVHQNVAAVPAQPWLLSVIPVPVLIGILHTCLMTTKAWVECLMETLV